MVRFLVFFVASAILFAGCGSDDTCAFVSDQDSIVLVGQDGAYSGMKITCSGAKATLKIAVETKTPSCGDVVKMVDGKPITQML